MDALEIQPSYRHKNTAATKLLDFLWSMLSLVKYLRNSTIVISCVVFTHSMSQTGYYIL